MKNVNKFIVKSANRTAIKHWILFAFIIIFANKDPMIVYANSVSTVEQVTSEELVFDTNSTDNVIMEGMDFNKFECSNDFTTENENDELDETICQEITNRIDVCKANTEVLETTENISEIVENIEESKQQNDLIEEQNAAEEAVCNAASENVPNGVNGCRSYVKTYMPYTAVTSKNSDQYKLLYSDRCYTDQETGLRMVDGRYCIAVGTGYCSKIGTKIDLVMENGNIIKCILGDVKADCDTDSTNRYHTIDGSVAEFIVDYSIFNSVKDASGTVNWIDGFDGNIKKVVVLND